MREGSWWPGGLRTLSFRPEAQPHETTLPPASFFCRTSIRSHFAMRATSFALLPSDSRGLDSVDGAGDAARDEDERDERREADGASDVGTASESAGMAKMRDSDRCERALGKKPYLGAREGEERG